MPEKLRVAVVGLSFGGGYLPALLAHPQVQAVGLCDVNPNALESAAKRFGIGRESCFESLDRVIESGRFDAIMLLSPIPFHADQAVAVLDAGLHCACTVPMATTVMDCDRVSKARLASGKTYCLLETSLCTQEFFFVQDSLGRGELGNLQFMRGVWHNHLDQHPAWWHGLPPMHYITHPLAPMLALAGRKVGAVSCFGSGTLPPGFEKNFGNPFPIETAIFQLGAEPLSPDWPVHGNPKHPLSIEVTSITAHTALHNKETFDVFGSRESFFWASQPGEEHTLVRRTLHEPRFHDKSNPVSSMKVRQLGMRPDLPDALRQIGGWAPQSHLVHEFVTASLAGRRSRFDVEAASAFSIPGILAHEKALAARNHDGSAE